MADDPTPIVDPEEFDTLGDFVSHIVDKSVKATRDGFLKDLTDLIDLGASSSDDPPGGPKIDPPTPPVKDPVVKDPATPVVKVSGSRKWSLL